MRIVYFADTRFPIERANGVQTMATCHALAARGHDVTLVVRPDTSPTPQDPFAFYGLVPEPRLRVHAVGGPRLPAARRAGFLLSAMAHTAHAGDGVAMTRDLGVAAFLLRTPFIRRVPVVYESHGIADVVGRELPALLGPGAPTPSRSKLARLARREAAVWERADSYVTITRALADELAARFGPRDRVFDVPDGAWLDEAADTPPPARASEAKGPLVVGYAGHLYPWKGVDVLIRALARVPDVRAIVIGGHPAERDRARVERLAHDLGIAGRVTFTGLVPPAEVRRHLSGASVVVLPNTASAISERYTSPLKLFEYLALGRAIVASDLPAVREVLTHDRTAVLVTPGDETALASALAALRDDPAHVAQLASAARALAPAYTWARRAERLEAALEAAVGAFA